MKLASYVSSLVFGAWEREAASTRESYDFLILAKLKTLIFRGGSRVDVTRVDVLHGSVSAGERILSQEIWDLPGRPFASTHHLLMSGIGLQFDLAVYTKALTRER